MVIQQMGVKLAPKPSDHHLSFIMQLFQTSELFFQQPHALQRSITIGMKIPHSVNL